MIATGKPLAGEEMITFMREQSDATRRLLFDLNGSYHSPEEIVALFSRITDNKVDDSFHLFPPFYTDFGKNIHLGKNVFINSCCQFQDQVWGIERSGFFNGREKWAKGFENQRV